MQTRREAVILMTAIPLLSTDAVAQDAVAQPDRLDALFNHPAENLSVPSRVRPALCNLSLLHSTAEPPGTDAFEI